MQLQGAPKQEVTEQPEHKSLWRHKNFLRLWAGQSISLLGSQVTVLALPLTAVLTLHATVFQMGVLRAASSLPILLLGLFAGVWIDRMRRRPLLILTDLGRALLLGSIPVAAYFHFLSIAYLYIIAILVAGLTLFFDVAHMSFLPSLVTREHIAEGNSKLEISRSGAWIAGPGLAGLLIQLVTAPISIIVDAISFVCSAWFIASIRATESGSSVDQPKKASIWLEMREGLHFIWSNPVLRAITLSTGAYNFFFSMMDVVYLLYVVRTLNIAPSVLGVILAIGSAGFPLGAMAAGAAAKRFRLGPLILWTAVVSDLAFLLVLPTTRFVFLAVPLLIASKVIATFAGPITAINQLSLRQMITPDRLQGRVNGTMRFIAQCTNPLGAFLGGVIGAISGFQIPLIGTIPGLQIPLFIGAFGLQLGFVILFFSPVRYYEKEAKEILPEDNQ